MAMFTTPPLQPGHLPDGGDGILQGVEHLNHIAEEKTAVPVQGDLPPFSPLKELNADVALQLGDGAAQGRWVMCSSSAARVKLSNLATVLK